MGKCWNNYAYYQLEKKCQQTKKLMPKSFCHKTKFSLSHFRFQSSAKLCPCPRARNKEQQNVYVCECTNMWSLHQREHVLTLSSWLQARNIRNFTENTSDKVGQKRRMQVRESEPRAMLYDALALRCPRLQTCSHYRSSPFSKILIYRYTKYATLSKTNYQLY